MKCLIALVGLLAVATVVKGGPYFDSKIASMKDLKEVSITIVLGLVVSTCTTAP